MPRSLWAKFLLLLLGVSAVALSSALVLRGLLVRDFRDYVEGDYETRIYWITADAERTYAKYRGWSLEVIEEDTVWALMLGFEVRFLDAAGSVVTDTERALAALPSPAASRSLTRLQRGDARAGEYLAYPLFVDGSRIGTLEVRPLGRPQASAFVSRSNRLLVISLLAVGGLALVLSAVASRRLTRPLKELATAATAISEGDLEVRAAVRTRDEVGALAEAFNGMAQALQRLEDVRKKLITNLAHDLRTPLGAIRAELEGMMDGLIPAGKEQLRSIHDETARLRRMLDGIEELARAQASALGLVKQPVALAPFLEHLAERARQMARGRRVTVALECPDALSLHADPDKVSQVVLNLLDNAVRAVGEAGTVTLRATATPQGIDLAVEDDGAGIAEADLPYVFERFFRRAAGGLGLGLAIAKELVEAHGGTLEARSAIGKGSVFTVHLPPRAPS